MIIDENCLLSVSAVYFQLVLEFIQLHPLDANVAMELDQGHPFRCYSNCGNGIRSRSPLQMLQWQWNQIKVIPSDCENGINGNGIRSRSSLQTVKMELDQGHPFRCYCDSGNGSRSPIQTIVTVEMDQGHPFRDYCDSGIGSRSPFQSYCDNGIRSRSLKLVPTGRIQISIQAMVKLKGGFSQFSSTE